MKRFLHPLHLHWALHSTSAFTQEQRILWQPVFGEQEHVDSNCFLLIPLYNSFAKFMSNFLHMSSKRDLKRSTEVQGAFFFSDVVSDKGTAYTSFSSSETFFDIGTWYTNAPCITFEISVISNSDLSSSVCLFRFIPERTNQNTKYAEYSVVRSIYQQSSSVGIYLEEEPKFFYFYRESRK